MTSGDPGAALVAERILFALTEDEGMLARFARCHRLGRGSDALTNCRNFALRSLERPAQFRSCAVRPCRRSSVCTQAVRVICRTWGALTVAVCRWRCGQDVPVDHLHLAPVPTRVYAFRACAVLCELSCVRLGECSNSIDLADVPTVFDNYSTPSLLFLDSSLVMVSRTYDRPGANVRVDGRMVNLGSAPCLGTSAP